MSNYEKAVELMNKGFARKHDTFNKTGYLVLNLGEAWVGYIGPKDVYVDVALNNTHIGHSDIDLDKMMAVDASHRPDYDRSIEKWK